MRERSPSTRAMSERTPATAPAGIAATSVSTDLPDWLFDVDDEDDIDDNLPILEELEIDIHQIYR